MNCDVSFEKQSCLVIWTKTLIAQKHVILTDRLIDCDCLGKEFSIINTLTK